MKNRISIIFFILFLILTTTADANETVTKLIKEGDVLYYKRDSVVKLEESYTKYKQALEMEPSNSGIYWRIARYYYNKGEMVTNKQTKMSFYQEVENWAKKGIEKNKNDLECHYWCAVGMGKYGDARGVLKSLFLVKPIKDECEFILKKNSMHAGARHILGVMYRKLPGFAGGSNEKSIEYLSLAIQYDPNDTLHYLELAKTYIAEKQYDLARNNLEKISKITNPEDRVQAQMDIKEAKQLLEEIKDK